MKSLRIFFKTYAFFFLLISLSLPCLAAEDKESALPSAPALLLGPVGNIEEIPAYRLILNAKSPRVFERAKIQWLLARITKCQWEFVRNGEIHSGKQAAKLLTYKYHKRFDQVRDIQTFIDEIASRSATSGQFYRIRIPDGEARPLREILLNEAAALENKLTENQIVSPVTPSPHSSP